MTSFTKLKHAYSPLWERAVVTKRGPAKKEAELVLKHKAFFIETQRRTGVPWYVVGIIHLREAGASDFGQWKRVIHNGQRIIGTGKKTTIVPKGRGPFPAGENGWHVAAEDAFKLKNLHLVKDWSLDRIGHVFESYNGFGYRSRDLPSPYLWGGTSVQKRGKYVADHVFDPNEMDTQIGTMAVLKELVKMDATIKFGKPIIPGEIGTAAGTGAVGVAVAASSPIEYWPWILAGTAVAAVLGFILVRYYKRKKGMK